MITNSVSSYINKENLFSLNNKILVALSGGADSVALLRVLIALGYICEAAHCNFQLRGNESERDALFVKNLCQSLNIPLHTVRFETTTYAKEKKISIEMAARELRYEWFQTIKEKIDANVVAIAHHQDDSVETILINLIRGTGINGLLGIRPENGNIVRPLLCVAQSDILQYLDQIGQDYVTDSTNLENEYTRNKIRLDVLPQMKEINPSVNNSILATSKRLSEVAAIYNKVIEAGKARIKSDHGISIEALLNEPFAQSLLFETLHPLGFNAAQIRDIHSSLSAQPGKFFISNTGWRVTKDREELIIDRPNNSETPPFKIVYEEHPYTPQFVIPKDKNTGCFDLDKLTLPLTIRKWEKGDFFFPFGMKGKKLVSDYLTEKKLSLPQKENQWVLCNKEEIVWVVGQRTDNRFRVDDNTQRVLVARIDSEKEKINT